jgi:hypothetical protein
MVLDNADDESVFYTQRKHGRGAVSDGTRGGLTLANALPQSQNGSILITSRNRDVAVKLTGRDKDVFLIQTMSRDQGLKLLQNKLSCPLDEPASDLLTALDYIPLAITQAAAYINKRWPRTTVASYPRELHANDKRRAKLLNHAATDLRRDEEASNSILTTWQISFEYIREETPSAANLLSFMSFFNPQGIPEFLIRDYSGSESDTEDDKDEESIFEDNLDILRSYSLVTTNLNSNVFEMHRLIQFATRTWLRSFGGEEKWWHKFLATLSKEFPRGEFNNWSQCQLLLPHVEPLVSEEPIDSEEAKCWARILYNAAWYTWAQGLYSQAEEMVRGSISARTKTLGGENADTLASVDLLAIVLRNQGRYEEAEQMNRRALQGHEKVLGKEHPDTLTSVGNLALVLQGHGKYEEAEQMNRRALQGSEKVLGKEHPQTLASLYCLAYLYHQCKRYDAASELYERACDAYKRTLGPNHRTTIKCCNHFSKMVQERRNR